MNSQGLSQTGADRRLGGLDKPGAVEKRESSRGEPNRNNDQNGSIAWGLAVDILEAGRDS